MLGKFLVALALCALPLLIAVRATEAAGPEIVSTTITPFVGTIGERMTLTIVIDHDVGTEIAGPGADGAIGGLEILAISEPVTVATEAGEETTLAYTLTSFRVGPGSIPVLELRWSGPSGSGIIRTEEVLYAVDSVLQPGDDSLRPLKAQLTIPQPAPPPFVPATLIAMTAVLTACGYVLMRRAIGMRPAAPIPVFVEPPASPAVAARMELDAISGEGIARTDTAAYYARVAGAVRRYLSARFEFPAFALTRREMSDEMQRAGIDRWPARLTENLLEQSDAAEFARFEPAIERREQDLAAAYEIIELTSGETSEPTQDKEGD